MNCSEELSSLAVAVGGVLPASASVCTEPAPFVQHKRKIEGFHTRRRQSTYFCIESRVKRSNNAAVERMRVILASRLLGQFGSRRRKRSGLTTRLLDPIDHAPERNPDVDAEENSDAEEGSSCGIAHR